MPFGKHEGQEIGSLIVEAAQAAIRDAGIAPADDTFRFKPACWGAATPTPCKVKGAKLGGVYNMGGACIASYVGALEALR